MFLIKTSYKMSDFNLQDFFQQQYDGRCILLDKLKEKYEAEYNEGKLALVQKEKDDYIKYLEEKTLVNELLSNDDSKENRNRHLVNIECYDGKKAENVQAEQDLMESYMKGLDEVKRHRAENEHITLLLKNPEISMTHQEFKKIEEEYDEGELVLGLITFLKEKYTENRAEAKKFTCEGCLKDSNSPVKCKGCDKVLDKRYCTDCYDKIADNDMTICRYGYYSFYCNIDCIETERERWSSQEEEDGVTDQQRLDILKASLAKRGVPYPE